jgi:tetratricopeptide (TPR) repeat protein
MRRAPRRAEPIAPLALIICITLHPLGAAAQPRCEVAAGSIVSAEGEISILGQAGGLLQSVAAGTEPRLCPGEIVVVGARSRAALRLEDTGQVIRLDQGTTLRVLPPRRPGRPLLDLSRGIIELFSPGNRPLDVETPYVIAGVTGTEFFVLVDPSRRIAEVGVIDGRVGLENAQGRLSLAAGEAAVAQPGLPLRRIEIRPRDQVRWAIFYPPAMWELPAGAAPIDPRVYTAWQAWRAGDFRAAVRQINAISTTDGFNAVSLDYLAAILISLGRVDEASALLARSMRLDPTSPRAPALQAVVEIARNQVQAALQSADAAVALAPTSPAARIAQSYALQAGLRLEDARAALLAAAPANDPLVLARLAEVEFYLGNIAAARSVAERAIAAAPSLSRPRSILGFVYLAQYFFEPAEQAFRGAAVLDAADPLPRIGLGLTAIRLGHLAAGTREIEIAVALDPASSVLRSYLGKAYAAEWDYDAALRQWRLAKQSDPNDPTHWLYQALAERSLNRPGEALANLQQSIALNNNRAVFRSRLLLDQDLATRGADLAGIYRDLGFDQAALDEAYKSVNTDPSNPSAHRFLSETFLGLPRFETASDSELLQSLLLQPLDINPPPPRLSRQALAIRPLFEPYRIGYNEFSPLFASNGLGLLADGFAGNFGTIGGTLLASGLYQNLSGSIGQFYSRTDGIHANGDLRRRISDLIFQPALSDQASLFAEYRFSDFDAGDFQNRFNLANFNPVERQTDDTRQYRLGGRFDAAPGVTFVGAWTGDNAHVLTNEGPSFSLPEHVDANTGEAAAYLTGHRFNIVLGGSAFSGRDQLSPLVFGNALPITTAPTDDHNIWLYGNMAPVPGLQLTLGGDFDQLRAIINRTGFEPKVGISWNVVPNTTLRAAWFETVKRPLIAPGGLGFSFREGETIEPTQVAGFNQLFDDLVGTMARDWGVGFDQRFSNAFFASDTLLLGGQWLQRQLEVPFSVTTSDGETAISEPGWKERLGRFYLSWLPTERIALNTYLDYQALHRTFLGSDIDGFTKIQLLQIPVELRYFDPNGLLGLVRINAVREQGQFRDVTTPFSGALTSGRGTFATVDMGIGWRYPGRPLIATVEVQNLMDSHIHYQDIDQLNPRIFARRTFLARISFRL